MFHLKILPKPLTLNLIGENKDHRDFFSKTKLGRFSCDFINGYGLKYVDDGDNNRR